MRIGVVILILNSTLILILLTVFEQSGLRSRETC